MADQEQTALWADANRRVLDDLSELSIAAVKETLLESVDTAQRTFRLIGANAKALSQAVDRVHATAEQTGQRVQETLSTSASRAREAVRRAA
ncbi:MAG: hypothetical protein AUG80_13150 [Candidatus Rokubacteria bacterium 13_1_20CM_4_68_9]|nr:MAG: hypothetical protein AUG80_13150 [Candidatus Rokubacteria bacterium 13_1_20CM_4_68_9]